MKKNLFLVYGGKSQEHDISLSTAFNISQVLQYDNYTVYPIYIKKDGTWIKGEQLLKGASDIEQLQYEQTGQVVLPNVVKCDNAIVFPVLHGPNGEDGTIQGLFEMLDVAYVGTGVMASACGMDKIISKKIFEMAGLPQLPYAEVLKKHWVCNENVVLDKIEQQLPYPMFVKPANMGSSVGVSKANTRDELKQAIQTAMYYDRRVVVEKGIVAREVEVALLGNDTVQASVVGEVVKTVDFYDFDEKYKNGTAALQIPADLSTEISNTLRNYAIRAFEALDCSGLTRCDFFLTENNTIYINEVNTLPGFTQFSMYPLLWEASGMPYDVLVETLLNLAVERYEAKKVYQTIQ